MPELPSWVPDEKEAQYLGILKGQWTNDWNVMSNTYDFFQRKNLISYMQANESDSYLLAYVTRKEAWRSNTRRQTIREKIDTVMAAVADLNLQAELSSYTMWGESAEPVAEGLEVLLEHADGLNLSEEKDKLSTLYLLVHGTISEDVQWQCRYKVEKTSEWDPTTMKFSLKERKNVEPAFEQIWTQVHPLNRILLGDITQPFMHLQPHIWSEYVMPWESGDTIFGEWQRWKFVKPMTATMLDAEQSDLITQTQEEQATATEPRMIRARIYENIWRNEYAIIINNVLMTPVGLTLPTKLKDLAYSKTWQQLFPFSPHFAPGMSFVQRMHNDGVLLDFFYNALVDKARQGIEPPLVSSFRTIYNRNMFRPGNVSQGDVSSKPLITHQGVTQSDMGMIEYIETNLDKASTPPIASGQGSPGGTTAYEIREQQRAALRTMWNVFSAVAGMKRQRTELMLRLVMENYPKLKVQKLDDETGKVVSTLKKLFTVTGPINKDGIEGNKEVGFATLPMDGKEAYKVRAAMKADSTNSSYPKKRILLDPDVIKEMRHTIQVIVNPADRKSKKADKAEVRDEYQMYVNNPGIDQAWANKMLLVANGRDPEDALAKAPPPGQQPGMPGQPPQGMPGQPGMPSSPPQDMQMNKQMQAAGIS